MTQPLLSAALAPLMFGDLRAQLLGGFADQRYLGRLSTLTLVRALD